MLSLLLQITVRLRTVCFISKALRRALSQTLDSLFNIEEKMQTGVLTPNLHCISRPIKYTNHICLHRGNSNGNCLTSIWPGSTCSCKMISILRNAGWFTDRQGSDCGEIAFGILDFNSRPWPAWFGPSSCWLWNESSRVAIEYHRLKCDEEVIASHTKVVLLWHPFLASRSDKQKETNTHAYSYCTFATCFVFIFNAFSFLLFPVIIWVFILHIWIMMNVFFGSEIMRSQCEIAVLRLSNFNVFILKMNLQSIRWFWLSNSSKPWNLPQLCRRFTTAFMRFSPEVVVMKTGIISTTWTWFLCQWDAKVDEIELIKTWVDHPNLPKNHFSWG